jgi:hypothetical protein
MSSKHHTKKAHTGKCTIYDKIDALANCANLPESQKFPALITQIQAILNNLAYYAINSDGAVLESHEEWHDTFADRLYEAAGQSRREAIAARATTTGAAPGGPSLKASISDTSDRALPAPIPTRKAPSDIPASLRAIYEGTHSSLREEDDE